MSLPQEFPRDLVMLRLKDVLPGLAPEAQAAYQAAFEARRREPLASRGLLLLGQGGLPPLMALMRLVVLRFRDLNFERFEEHGGEGRYLSAYATGANLDLPLPERASALFIERADLVPHEMAPALALALSNFPQPLFATWEGPTTSPVWDALARSCQVITL